MQITNLIGQIREINLLHMWDILKKYCTPSVAKFQITPFEILVTTRTYKIKYFILYINFNSVVLTPVQF